MDGRVDAGSSGGKGVWLSGWTILPTSTALDRTAAWARAWPSLITRPAPTARSRRQGCRPISTCSEGNMPWRTVEPFNDSNRRSVWFRADAIMFLVACYMLHSAWCKLHVQCCCMLLFLHSVLWRVAYCHIAPQPSRFQRCRSAQICCNSTPTRSAKSNARATRARRYH
jgi:hypothetical protein